MRRTRPPESVTDPASGGIRWFKLYEDLEEFGDALAYPTRWNEQDHKWESSDVDAERRAVRATVEGYAAAANDIAPFWWNSWGRTWELLTVPGFLFIGKADAEIASGATGTVSVWTGTAGSETDSDENRDGYNRTGLAIGSGDWCLGMRINNQWYLEPWECA
jgi:hypothetical protein